MEVGLAYIVAAKEMETNGVAAYSDGMVLAEAVDANITITRESKKFYSNNGVRAVRERFKEGSVKLGLDDLSQEGHKFLFGGTESAADIEGDAEAKELAVGGDDVIQPVGVGFYATKMVGDEVKYRAIWLRKVRFAPPSEEFKTEGESFEFMNPSITGEIFEVKAVAADTKKRYKDEVTVDTEAKAVAWLNAKAGITAA